MNGEIKPIAWRIRLGDSDLWSYVDNEADADFYIKQSGLKKFGKEPLYAAPWGGLEAAAQIIESNMLVDADSGERLAPRSEWNRVGLSYAAAIRALADEVRT